MGNKYKCEVLLSSYNGQDYIRQQVDSILNQSDVDVYLTIRDDGSSDSTMSILHEFEKEYEGKVKIMQASNVGIHKSFADLINHAKGETYVAFADQDDIWDLDKLKIAIETLTRENADFYSSAARLVDSNLQPIGSTTSNLAENNHYQGTRSSILTPGTQGCTIVLTPKFFNDVVSHGLPDYYGHDTWITLVAYYTVKCVYDETPHMSYRQHDRSWTGNRKNKIQQKYKQFKFFISGMSRYSELANDILSKYSDHLSNEDRQVMEVLSKHKKSLKEKLLLLFDGSFSKYGFFRNLIFKFEILLGNV